MSEDFARDTAAPRAFALDGKQYLAAKLTPRGLGDLQAFFKDAVPDPRVVVRPLMGGLPDAVQLEMWRTAHEDAKNWPPQFGSPETLPLLLSEEGQARLLWVALRAANPGFDLEKAREVSRRIELTQDQVEALMEIISPGETGDPKSPGTAAGP